MNVAARTERGDPSASRLWTARPTCRATPNSSNLFRHDVRSAITATQQAIGFLIGNHLLLRRIEAQRTAKTVRSIGQVHASRRDVGFLNRRMNILGTTAADAINEVRVVVSGAFAGWPGFDLIR